MNSENRQVALVTGAARRIGATICEVLHEAGYDVLVHCHRSRREAEALAGLLNARRRDSAQVLQGPIGPADAAGDLAAAVLGSTGRIDLLVNNASAFRPTPVGSVGEADWDELLDSNLKGPFFLAQALAPNLQENSGNIVNIVDIHAERPMAGHTVYCVAKAGLAMLTRSLARELAPGVRVNGVAPGAILWPEGEPESDAPASHAKILERVPLGRTGQPEDIARAVLYLARDAGYVTGQIIAVDGGRSLNV